MDLPLHSSLNFKRSNSELTMHSNMSNNSPGRDESTDDSSISSTIAPSIYGMLEDEPSFTNSEPSTLPLRDQSPEAKLHRNTSNHHYMNNLPNANMLGVSNPMLINTLSELLGSDKTADLNGFCFNKTKERSNSPVDSVAFNTSLFSHLSNQSSDSSFNSVLDDSLEQTLLSLPRKPDWHSPPSNESYNWASATYPGAVNSSSPTLTTKQTIQCLEMLQEMQESSLKNDAGPKAAQKNMLTNMLQHHLLSNLLLGGQQPQSFSTNYDKSAKGHREGAGNSEPTCTWSGQLLPRQLRNPVYSCKVFLGGVPWDITEQTLVQTFKPFGNIKVEWPGKDGVQAHTKGYVYIIFETDKQVKHLLQSCTQDYAKGVNWYYKISSKKMKSKDVQVIPWPLSDSNHIVCQSAKLDPQRTIFVGALHGMLNAEGLATIMEDLFGGVVYAGIDTDRHKYPIGSARITFNNHKSYMKAISAAFIEIKTARFSKKVQLDPYLDDSICSDCNLQQGPYFCRDLDCFRYFCRTCFQTRHSNEAFRRHRALMRNSNKQQGNAGSNLMGSFQSNQMTHSVGNFVGNRCIQNNHVSNGFNCGGFRGPGTPMANGNNLINPQNSFSPPFYR